MVALALVCACVVTNPSWDPPDDSDDGRTSAGDPLDTGDNGEAEGRDLGSSGPSEGTDTGESTGDGDGDGDGPTSGESGDGDGDDDVVVCDDVAPSFGPCPQGCDECHDGVCWRICADGQCQDDFVVCPVAWSCKMLCLGKDSCKNATLACTGWGSCEVECEGDNACTSADILCSGGPCAVTCGAGHDKPCEHTEVWCGGDRSTIHCEEPYAGSGPTLIESNTHECGCTSDCVPA